jgi:hypothetical protein
VPTLDGVEIERERLPLSIIHYPLSILSNHVLSASFPSYQTNVKPRPRPLFTNYLRAGVLISDQVLPLHNYELKGTADPRGSVLKSFSKYWPSCDK